jgi:hypothetical protein
MRALLPLALGLLPLGCYHDIHDHFAPTYQVQEQEPNNAAFSAQGIGGLNPGTQIDIFGYVAGQDGFGPDGVDGFAFVANTPLVIDFALSGQPGWYSDLDLCLYDPYSGTYVDCWQSWDSDEYGSFYVPTSGQEFHLVVLAASGAANYVLSVSAHAAGTYYASAASAMERGFEGTQTVAPHASQALDRYRDQKPDDARPAPQTRVELWLLNAEGRVERRKGELIDGVVHLGPASSTAEGQ